MQPTMPSSTQDFEHYRPHLTGHCYCMLGSVFDADDAVQETLVRAWRSADGFEGRAAVRSWLYRIATNVCLDFIAERKRRARPIELAPAGVAGDALEPRPREEWLEPIPDAAILPVDTDPHEALALRQGTRLAFVSALQQLPGKQRAALLMTELLECSAAETAESLGMTTAAVNSALQRAREKLAAEQLAGLHVDATRLSETQSRLLERYLAAFEAFDVAALKALLHEDAQLSMPPFCLWIQGPEHIERWLHGPGSGCRGSRLLPTSACCSPAFAQYRPDARGGYAPWALIVLELTEDAICGWNTFLDVERLFPRFGLPARLD
jgi:RNA polymerase sigma-70 factor, ECF subfamily